MTPHETEVTFRQYLETEYGMIQFHIGQLSFDFIRQMKDYINGLALLKYQSYHLTKFTQKQKDELKRYYRIFDD